MAARLSHVAQVVLGAAFAAAGLGACSRPEPHADPAPSASTSGEEGDRERAASLESEKTTLPSRAEVVALTDRLAIAAERSVGARIVSPEAAELTSLAAKLRERLWRHDGVPSDAREATELYRVAVDRAPSAPFACDAEARLAVLSGELARDAEVSYRALYLVRARHAPSEVEAVKKCVARVATLLGAAAAFRPTGADWVLLEERGRNEAATFAAEKAKPRDREPSSTATESARAPDGSEALLPSASAAVPPFGPAAQGGLDVVVKPDASVVKSRADLTRLEPYSWQGGGRLVLTLSAPLAFDVGVLAPDASAQRGHRIYLDLAGAKQVGVSPEVSTTGLIGGVRLGKRGDGVRVVIDLVDAAHHRVFYLPDPFRVVVDLSTRPPVAVDATPQRSLARTVRRVVLDPGHGGMDAGAQGPTGLREKDVVLDVAHRAAPALAHELGVETMLTRDGDAYVPLEERTARANAFHADLFVSIHCNATEDGNAKGLEVYILDPSRETDAVARRSVMRENHLVVERGKSLDIRVLDAQIASVASGLNASATTEGSRLFAQLLRRSAVSSLSQRYGQPHDHGVKTAAFFVLLGAEMPATLFETAFISNPEDEARLGTADFRQKLADSIVNSVRAYRDGMK